VIAGFMFKHSVARDKIFYHRPPLGDGHQECAWASILVSRSGFTAWGVSSRAKANLTLISAPAHLVALAGERIVFDQDLSFVEEESAKHRRKAAVHDE
jgi:FdhD protein